MAKMLRCLAGLLFVTALTWADCHQARAQTSGSDRRQGSTALLDAMRSAELRSARADEEKSKTDPASLPAAAFPLPSCLFPGGLCGAFNRDGSVAIAPRYDWVDKFHEGRALVRFNGQYGYVDATGRVIDEPKYETAGAYSQGLAEVSIGGLSGLIDLEGRLVLTPQFARVHGFTSDVFWVNDGRRRYHDRPGLEELIGHEAPIVTNDIGVDGKWGLIARTGEWIRKPEFAAIRVFDRDDRSLALVKAEAGWGVIKPDGAWWIEPKFEALGRLHNGLAPARIGGRSGFVDRTGAFVIPPKFDRVESFERDGLGTASIGKLWGLIDRSGAWVVEPQYEGIMRSRDKPIMWFRSGEKYGAVDRSGKLIVAPRFSQPGDIICDDGWAIGFDNGKRRAVPREGMQFVLPDGDLSGSNCEDPLQIEANGKFGLVDRTLNPLTEVKFDSIAGFFNGTAIAKADGKFGYLNPDGSWLIEPRFETTGNFAGEYAVASLKGKFGCLRRNGAWEIEPQFQDMYFNCELVTRLATARPGAVHPGVPSPIDPRIQKIAGLAPGYYAVKLEGKFGVVNDAFDWVIEPRWQSYGMFFRGGLVAAKFDDKWGFIDASGALIIPAMFDGFGVFQRGIAWMQTGGSWCAINRLGQRVPSLSCLDADPNPKPGIFSSRIRP
jgi:hypothetical protein